MKTQTSLRSRIRERQNELGFTHQKKFGQNFLISDGVVQKILSKVAGFSPEFIIEIGPGLGSLTDGLLALGLPIQLIELDDRLANFWEAQNCKVIRADALLWNWGQIKSPQKGVLVSNLPYQISSRILVDRTLDQHPLKGMVLMFQKEVAQKIVALTKHSDFGFLSVFAQTFWDIDFVLEASSGDFEPAPKVASRVLSFSPKSTDIPKLPFLKYLKVCFSRPRQTLLKNLKTLIPADFGSELLQELNLAPMVRPHQLELGDFQQLFLNIQAGRAKK